MKKVQKKHKYFWIYTIVLFSVALVLILFSAFSATNIPELENENKRKIQSVDTTINQLKEENTALKEKNEALEKEKEAVKSATESILTAEELYTDRQYADAKEEIDKITDASVIEGKLLEKYENIKNKIYAEN